jgi:hypothetical protein
MKKQMARIILIFMASATVVIGFGQGCAKTQKSSNAGSVDAASQTNNNTSELDPNSQTLSLVYNKQILDHMVSCSGIGVASDETLITWSEKRGAVSIDGTVLSLTSPMLMAVTTIAGDVCRDLINTEKTTPRLFNNINWSATSLASDATLNDSIRGLALSCWQRQEADEERQVIMDALHSEFGTGTINNSDAFLFLCTSMLSSLDTLTL